MVRVSEMRYFAQCDMHYRYKCYKCGHETQWIPHKLKKIAANRIKYSRIKPKMLHPVKDLEKTKDSAYQQLQELQQLLQNMLDETKRAHVLDDFPAIEMQFNDMFRLAKSCPKCKARQDWYPATTLRKSDYTAHWDASRTRGLLISPTSKGAIEVVWSKSTVALIGAPDESEYQVDNQPKAEIFFAKTLRLHHSHAIKKAAPPPFFPPVVKHHCRTVMDRKMRSAASNFLTHKENVSKPENTFVHLDVLHDRASDSICIEDIPYWHLRNYEHENMLFIFEVVEREPGVFSILQEKHEHITLAQKMDEGLSESEIRDFGTQIIDVLKFLHKYTPPITCNSLLAEDILICKNNLLKLHNFDTAIALLSNSLNNTAAFQDDIAAFGKLLQAMTLKCSGKHAQYDNIINKCSNREYDSVNALDKDFKDTAKPQYPIWVAAITAVFLIILILSRRML